jgi:MSHA pilin protein MshA
MKKQAGFTLIELIMVIVILGILSAFALPRFADLSGSAQSAANQGIVGSVRSASSIAHAAYLAAGNSGLTVSLEGVDYDVVDGYLEADQIETAAQVSGVTSPALVARVAGTPDTAGTAQWTLDDGTGATCTITYTEAVGTAAATVTTNCP